jgi:amidase
MGQTLSPYRRPDLSDDEQAVSWPHPPQFQVLLTYGHVPGGSSSGSAVSVAAGLCPLAIGTETAGSVVFPASCNGLYGMKLTPGSVPGDGIFQLSESFDGVGVMARDPADVAAFAEILQTGDGGEHNTPESLVDREIPPAKSTPMVGLSIGVVSNTWGLYEKKKWASPDVVSEPAKAMPLFVVDIRVKR